MDVHDHARGTDRRELCHGVTQLMLQRLLDPAGDGQHQRLAAGRGIGEVFIERPLDTGGAMTVDVGKAEYVGGEACLRIEAVWLALDR